MSYPSKHISLFINRSFSDVSAFASNPENLPKWASGLSGSISREGDHWVAASPMGKVKVKFAEPNNFGVIDHDVTLESGETFHNPMRIVKNHTGSEVIFTLYRQPGMSDEDYSRDAATIAKDLSMLKKLLESGL